ncbi:MAG: DsbA family protein [Parvularculaceae bacterium]|jgi:2-hydroxychromene-2-carboxylate isomerase|nr:DsbA family protein [Parvularculaceae bacterium]
MPRLDIYWSFRSPYSYLAIDRLCDIARTYPIETRFRPVRPLAMREPDFFEKNRPQFLPYLFKDVWRESQRLGVTFASPRPDPIAMDFATGKVAADQPVMEKLMGLAVAAVEHGKGLEFAQSVARRIWGGVENWDAGGPMAEACAAAGLDLYELERWARDNPRLIAETVAESEAEQLKHHWGVPLMVLDDEPFFGQDRLDSLVWRLQQLGLRPR